MFYWYFILDDSLFCPVDNQWDAYTHFKSFNSVTHMDMHIKTKIFLFFEISGCTKRLSTLLPLARVIH